jgi:hypothetical protein
MVSLLAAKVYLFAANVSPQEQLRGVNNVELSPVNKVVPSDEPERGISLDSLLL